MGSVIHYFIKTAEKFPDRTAAEDMDRQFTYRQINEASSRVACGISARIGTEERNVPIAVYLPKSIESVILFAGILKSGNPYVPIDYQIPQNRMKAMFENLEPAMVITDEAGKESVKNTGTDAVVCTYEELIASNADEELVKKALDEAVDTDPAYIMYTSGTTGVPKGVVISHRGICNYALWLTKEFKADENSVFGLQSGFHFDNCVFDIYGCFFTGAKMVIIPDILFMYPEKLLEFIKEKRVSIIFWVPTVMINTANSGALEKIKLPDMKTVVFAGEVMPAKQLNIWRRALPDCVYANLYGPTEITVDCLFYVIDREFEDSEPIPIGRDCENARVLILNGENEAATGEQGEICVLGSGVSLGYWNKPELTKKVFVQNPLNSNYNEIMYRTGDIGYKTEEGLVMYVGRQDSQFKLRGNRIELGEIEQNALMVPNVERACAVFDEKNLEIVAFIQSGHKFTLREFNSELKKYIPKYMLPSKIFVLEEFPFNQNRKIDRAALRKKFMED